MNTLTLRYTYDDAFDPAHDDPEDAGRLTLAVTTARFSGTGTFAATPRSLRAFGEALTTFPIPPDRPLQAIWGYEGRMARVAIRAVTVTGTLIVSVAIDDALSFASGDAIPEGVRAAFVTDYAQIDAFRRSVASLMDRKTEAAALGGH
jgi:hypothetical protein